MSKKFYDTDRPIKVNKLLPQGIADRLPEDITDETERQRFFMSQALILARRAAAAGDVPVGCVVVRHNEIIAAANNRREADKCAVSHAEILAVNDACKALGGWRLVSCELFVTLEPCPMCAGAIMNARVPKIYVGAPDVKGGAVGGLFDLFSYEVNHKPQIFNGVMESECAQVLTDFFKNKRERKES